MKKKVAIVVALLVAVGIGLFFVFKDKDSGKDAQDKVVNEFLTNLYTVKYDDNLTKLFEFEATSTTSESDQKSIAMESPALETYLADKFKSLLTEECFENSNKNRILSENLFYAYASETSLSPEKITIDSNEKDGDTVKVSATVEVSETKDEKALSSNTHKVSLYLKEESGAWKISYIKID